MKRILFFLPALLSLRASAQNKMPDPPYMNKVYLVEAAKDSLKQLAEETGTHSNKIAMFGKQQSGVDYSMDGAQSALRIAQSDSAAFEVSITGMMAMDPSMMFTLYQCTAKGSKRIVTVNGMSGANNNSSQNSIEVNVKKVKEDVYELIPAKKLDAGEYAFVDLMSSAMGGGKTVQLFTFGVGVK
jgi:hypothetical protein